MNKELFEALEMMEKERGINRDALIQGIESALKKSFEQTYGTSENLVIDLNREECELHVYRKLEVVDAIEPGRESLEISREKAMEIDPSAEVGDLIQVELDPKNFGRIAAQNGKSIILQKIREEERQTVNDYFNAHAHDIMTGIVQRVMPGGLVSVNLGKADAVLTKEDMIPGENFEPNQHIKVYVVGLKDAGSRGPRVKISRTNAAMVKRLFEMEVSEIREGIVEIKAISREAGSRTKMAVWSKDANVDPVGACIGMNSSRITPIVNELSGEKIDIIAWDENPAILVENSLSPAKVIAVAADEDEKTALVVVPDNQLSLAIGMKGQNARLAAKLTGYKIDIKSESQAREEGLFDDYEEEEEYEEEAYDEEASDENREG
ncbi:MAG: transcription termination/antitermination protein NusA [Lachnospiraceae bacterium]|nr:transcription termination/antitermination protein NusA [Lachnospiraceae bacterium]MBR5739079.1 transcription termination/antitermination protein NusA [Lachnospiraceae bacterium]